jgi:integrase
LVSENKIIGLSKKLSISKTDSVCDNKITIASDGLETYYENLLTKKTSKENALTIANYILSLRTEINLSENYQKMNIMALASLSAFLCQKDFRLMDREEIISFLDNLRRPEASDPLHKWIGTYNLFRVLFVKFFKWLYYPDIEQDKRAKPAVIVNIPRLKRKEKSIYKPSDLWTPEDDLLFLRYCPNIRDRCYHAISRDLSCRPSEILNLRLKDVVFKTSGTHQYADVLVNGKTGTRHVPKIRIL